ncbi:MAG: serine hydrolase [Cyanobacteriota bacterium]|nr:serine hydrolase [Cyanobacteriota bacterium]
MAFYSLDPAMGQALEALVRELEADGRPGLAQQLSLTWLRLDPDPAGTGPPRGASWNGDRQRYPASVVKLVYLIAAEAWIQRGLIEEDPELRRALAAMIRDSSNDATGLVVDLLSGTTSGPALPAERFAHWAQQRRLVNDWLASLGWPELVGCNCCQKTWEDGPYGRERAFYGEDLANRNRLSSDAVARLLSAVMRDGIVSPPACERMRALLLRSLDRQERAADPENQVDGFLGEAVPEAARLWSKAGWMSQARHDAACIAVEGQAPVVLVAFSEGRHCALDERLLPELSRRLLGSGCG